MAFSIYQAAVPPVLKTMNNFLGILDKAAAYAVARKVDPSVLMNSRLFPDMFPLVRQVQIVTDHAKGLAARLAGHDVPSYPDSELTFEDLTARLQKTITFVESIPEAAFDGAETRAIVLKAGSRELSFTGAAYLTDFALPNFYFHATTAYAILRHNGVELGKRDFV